MANGSRRRSSGGSRRSGARGTSRAGAARGPSRSSGGGGNNATPMIVGIVMVVAVVAVIVAVSGGKKKQKDPYVSDELTADSNVAKGATQPKKPERPPPPDISPEIITTAKEIVGWMDDELAQANAHYEAAMAAKNKGDEEVWQTKLGEAREHFLNIRERWNNEVVAEIEGELPMGCQWDADEVANHHVGKEAGKITKALKRLAYISKQLRR